MRFICPLEACAFGVALLFASALLLWAGASTPPNTSDFSAFKAMAEAGDVKAQVKLAGMYETGKGVERDSAESFKWWLKAAEQGLAVAQHNVGVAYMVGIGVERDRAKALRWFTKAAEQGDTDAELYAKRLKEGKSAAPLVVAKSGSRAPVASVLRGFAASGAASKSHSARYGEKEKICAEVVAEYVASHKYIPDDFICVDFAAGVWYELMGKGVLAKIRVGSRNVDIGSISEADHAWVMAEVSPETWLAIEPQRSIVYPEQGSKYYSGYDFLTDFPVREHNRRVHALMEEVKKYKEAKDKLDEIVKEYENGNGFTQRSLLPFIANRRQVVNDRTADVQRAKDSLSEILQRATPSP